MIRSTVLKSRLLFIKRHIKTMINPDTEGERMATMHITDKGLTSRYIKNDCKSVKKKDGHPV